MHKAVEIEMEDIEAGKSKTYSYEDIRKALLADNHIRMVSCI